ncbi:MAG: ArdC family protein [Chlorobiaceae bacterium]|nr:ArdC family protein [Chlorobiaceae bacterium]
MKTKSRYNEVKAKLIALSQAVKLLVEMGEADTINQALILHYQRQTEQTEFRSFYGWKDVGYKVKKGEHGFPVWSTPKTMHFKKTVEVNGSMEEQEKEVSRFAVAYLFHAGQVEKIENKN